MTDVPRSGTWARAEYNIGLAFAAVLEEMGGPQIFVPGRNLFAGRPLPSEYGKSGETFPAASFFAGPPAFSAEHVGRGQGRTLFSYDIMVYHKTRAELVDLTDALLAALNEANFRVTFGSGELYLPDDRATGIRLVADSR